MGLLKILENYSKIIMINNHSSILFYIERKRWVNNEVTCSNRRLFPGGRYQL